MSDEQQGLLSSFGNLANIEPPKDVQARPSSVLERLLTVGDHVVEEYAYKKLILVNTMNTDKVLGLEDETKYASFYEDIRHRLSEVSFNEEDLQGIVLAKANVETSIDKELVFGMYTGCLAQLLTERNRAQGKRTKIHIDGKGNAFNYLFLFAREVDDIIVENLKGSWICGYVASYNGHAHDIIGVNLEGYALFAYVGSDKGEVNRLVGIGLKNGLIMDHAFYNSGICSQIIAVGIRGNYNNLCYIGQSSNMVQKKSTIKQLIVVDVEGGPYLVSGVGTLGNKFNQVIAVKVDSARYSVLSSVGCNTEILQVIGVELKGVENFSHAADSGYIHQLYSINSEGEGGFLNLGYNSGKLGTVVAVNVKGNGLFGWKQYSGEEGVPYGPKKKNVKKIIHHDCAEISPFINAYTDNIVSGDKALAEYRQLSQKHHIEEIINLAKSMQGKSYPEVLDLADKLYLFQPDFKYDFSLHKKHVMDGLRRAKGFLWNCYYAAKYYLIYKFGGSI